MAQTTEKLNLKKPSPEDFYNIEDFNENFQKIDDFAKRKDSEISPITKGGTGGTTTSQAANNLMVKSIGYGITINENDDLNSYINVGNYICPLTVIAQSLSNCPITSAFNMTVSLGNGSTSYLIQELTHFITGVKYFRSYSGNTKEWGDWKVVYSTANKPTPADIGAAKVALGSYTGNGNSGSTKPCKLTINPTTKMIYIISEYGWDTLVVLRNSNIAEVRNSGGYEIAHCTWTDNEFSWYSSNAEQQLNESGIVYNYILIG